MKVVAVVQARLSSTRLPRKVLADIVGKPMLAHCVERLSAAKTVHKVVVACPIGDAHELRRAVGHDLVCEPSGASENDLAARHAIVARAYDADVIVRVPSDNPCVDPEQVDRMVTHFLGHTHPSRDTHLYSNIGPIGRNEYADGFGCEVYSRKLIEWMDANLPAPFSGQKQRGVPSIEDREHIHRHFIRHGHVRTIVAPRDARDYMLRFDVNEQKDLDFVRDVFEACWRPDRHFTMAEAIRFAHGWAP